MASKGGNAMEMSRVEKRKREKSQPQRNKLEQGLVTLRALADTSRVITFLIELAEKLSSF